MPKTGVGLLREIFTYRTAKYATATTRINCSKSMISCVIFFAIGGNCFITVSTLTCARRLYAAAAPKKTPHTKQAVVTSSVQTNPVFKKYRKKTFIMTRTVAVTKKIDEKISSK